VPVGTGAILNGHRVLVPGLDIENWEDNPILRLRKLEDFRTRRSDRVRQIILHTTKGIPGGNDQREQVIFPGLGHSQDAGERCARWWSKSPESAGAHLVVDHDGKVFCCVDLIREAAQHARHANDTSVGIEIYQGRDAEMYEGQLNVVVELCDWLTRVLGIQRQIPHRYVGASQRLSSPLKIGDVVGILGHRDLATSRGRGDPGPRVMNLLGLAGYEPLDFDQSEDLEVWRRRQRDIGLKADGVPGPVTVAALRKLGRPHGMWIQRPGDLSGPRLVA
jgi:hypothetical protein